MTDKRRLMVYDWLKNEISKDSKEIDVHKNKLISEIKSIKKEEIAKPRIVKKKTIFEKILLILGYGKNR